MAAQEVSTARGTSLTAAVYQSSCCTLPLSILQATRLTGSSHGSTISTVPRRLQTRSSHTWWRLVANCLRTANRTKVARAGMNGHGVTRFDGVRCMHPSTPTWVLS